MLTFCTMILLKIAIFSIVAVGFSTCQRVDTGNCPNLMVKKDFDANQYLGGWYEIEKIPVNLEENLKCVTVNYTLESDQILISGKGIHSDGTEEIVIGRMAAPDKNVPAKMIITFEEQRFSVNYWILDTDYENYAVAYSCVTIFRIIHSEYLWIFSRQPSLENTTSEEIYKWLDSNEIDRGMLQKTDQSCK